jgi:hypothetical protein
MGKKLEKLPDVPRGGDHSAHHDHPSDPDSFGFAVWQLKDGENRVTADRLTDRGFIL